MDNKVSSAKAETPGIDWFCDIWQHRDCTGDTRRIQGDVPRLDDFNNVMSSYKCSFTPIPETILPPSATE